MENLHDKRKVYDKSQLLENQIKENPIELFRDWFLEAEENPAVSVAVFIAHDGGVVSGESLVQPPGRYHSYIYKG